jgi:hypothetical protein
MSDEGIWCRISANRGNQEIVGANRRIGREVGLRNMVDRHSLRRNSVKRSV